MEACEHVVYILECRDGSFYTGYTNNLTKRLRLHEAGKGAKYTKGRGPFTVKFIEYFSTKEAAMQQEYAIKQLRRKDKEQVISLNKQKDVVRDEDTKKL